MFAELTVGTLHFVFCLTGGQEDCLAVLLYGNRHTTDNGIIQSGPAVIAVNRQVVNESLLGGGHLFLGSTAPFFEVKLNGCKRIVPGECKPLLLTHAHDVLVEVSKGGGVCRANNPHPAD